MTEPKSSRPPRSSIILALLVSARFVIVVDSSIVQIALPRMRTELGISLVHSQWIVSAYGLSFAGFLLLSGRASDIYGRRKLFSIGLAVFAFSSLAGGLAPSEAVLIGARAVQGIGAAILSATALSLIIVSFPEERGRNRAISVYTAISSAGFAAGVIIGGVLTAALGWRSVFYVNVPICLVAALLTPRFLVESRAAHSETGLQRLDLPGALSVTTGLSLLVYALVEGANQTLQPSQALVFLTLSAFLLGSFLVIEHRSKYPLMPLKFLRRGIFLSANTLAILANSAVAPMVFLVTIYLQQMQGYSAFSAGIAFLPTTIAFLFAGGYLSSRLVSRFGVRPVLVFGMTIQAAGFLLLSGISSAPPYLSGLLPGMLVVSFGTGTSFTAFSIAALTGAEKGEEGLASGLLSTSMQVGGPIGLAIAVTIADLVVTNLGGSSSPASATVVGFGYAFIGCAALSCTGIVAALLIKTPKVGAKP